MTHQNWIPEPTDHVVETVTTTSDAPKSSEPNFEPAPTSEGPSTTPYDVVNSAYDGTDGSGFDIQNLITYEQPALFENDTVADQGFTVIADVAAESDQQEDVQHPTDDVSYSTTVDSDTTAVVTTDLAT